RCPRPCARVSPRRIFFSAKVMNATRWRAAPALWPTLLLISKPRWRAAPSHKARANWQRRSRNPGEGLSALVAGDLFDEIHNASAQPRVLDVREGLRQRQAIGTRQEIGDIVRDRSFRRSIFGLLGDGSIKKERHRHFENLRDVLKPACT